MRACAELLYTKEVTSEINDAEESARELGSPTQAGQDPAMVHDVEKLLCTLEEAAAQKQAEEEGAGSELAQRVCVCELTRAS